MEDPEVLRFLADRGSRAKWVTSVCGGSVVLGAAKVTQLLLEYDPDPPFDAGTPEKAGAAVMKKWTTFGYASRAPSR